MNAFMLHPARCSSNVAPSQNQNCAGQNRSPGHKNRPPPKTYHRRTMAIIAHSHAAMRTLLLAALLGTLVAAKSGFESTMGIVETNRSVKLDPSVQHVPLEPSLRHLRPPPPRVPQDATLFVGLAVFRDGHRCGTTIFTGFKRATTPQNIVFGVVDQVNPSDQKCADEYCAMAQKEWGECRHRDQIRVDERSAIESRGPTLARHQQQNLIRDEDFCLQLDGHSIFTTGWDENLLKEWAGIGNEMAVMTTYIHHIHDFVAENGDNVPPKNLDLPHLCTTMRGVNGLVRTVGASMIGGSKMPQLEALWGAGFSYSKCHAEKRVPVDSHTLWVFDGEEFLRASRLWTHGYDMYSPSKLGSVVYHNYTSVPARFEGLPVDQKIKDREEEMGINRFKLLVGEPFEGRVSTIEMDKYGFGNARSFQQYLGFCGVTFDEGKKDAESCEQRHWVPYTNATEVEAIVGGGWKLYGNVSRGSKADSVQHESEGKLRQHATESLEANLPTSPLPIYVVLVAAVLYLWIVPSFSIGKWRGHLKSKPHVVRQAQPRAFTQSKQLSSLHFSTLPEALKSRSKMNLSTFFIAFALLLELAAATVIDVNKVAPLAQPTPSTSAEKAAVKFKPRLSIGAGGCASFPAVNSAGETSSGLKEGIGGSSGCLQAPLGSQVYGRTAWYNSKFAIMYAWYFPKGFFNDYATRRHDWASAVVWLDSPDSASPSILGLSLSKSDWLYSTEAPATSGITDGTTPKLSHELEVELGDPYLTTTDTSGDSQDLILWEQLPPAARTALNTTDFGNARVPIADANFEKKLTRAWPF
ncbi:unnamed protein product [Phytophthora fragariaefolia]|uniref:Unnamed protein product n=1 Tax=Phytophthora fragariaefolia TaxID=1490495 RepID=A0A9W6WZR7_9STRA|nr:unnamed protein product [Phytophthora fragariaefolia]